MGFKTKVRKKLERIVSNYGYTLVKNPDLAALQEVIEDKHIPLDPSSLAARDSSIYTLAWLIPPMAPGAGGHRTIFRTISNLRKQGIRSSVYIYGPVGDLPSETLRQMVLDYYQIDLCDNEIYGNTSYLTYADGIMATSWETAYFANRFDNCLAKFYFVQDFEPLFYGRDSLYYLAENTYKLGFYGITAGHWLDKKCNLEYGMETVGFNFSYDRDVYKTHPGEKFQDDKLHIFFYARPSTGRRAFEMGVLSFTRLASLRDDFVVEFAGQSLSGYDLHFPYVDHGILSPSELSQLYSKCEISVVLSLTNLSLLPYEIMASGSVVLINEGENNSWAINETNAIVTSMDPIDIADKLDSCLSDKDRLSALRQAGMDSLPQETWFETSIVAGDFIKEKLDQQLV